MNEPAGADDPIRLHHVGDSDGEVIEARDLGEPDANTAVDGDGTRAAVSEDGSAEPAIREGSPFRVDPEVGDGGNPFGGQPDETDALEANEAFYDIGPARYMALGAVVAASVVMIFAVLSLIWFPGGGIMVAGLGCLLGILGLFSPRPKSAGGLLLGHFGLFIACYFRMLSA